MRTKKFRHTQLIWWNGREGLGQVSFIRQFFVCQYNWTGTDRMLPPKNWSNDSWSIWAFCAMFYQCPSKESLCPKNCRMKLTCPKPSLTFVWENSRFCWGCEGCNSQSTWYMVLCDQGESFSLKKRTFCKVCCLAHLGPLSFPRCSYQTQLLSASSIFNARFPYSGLFLKDCISTFIEYQVYMDLN